MTTSTGNRSKLDDRAVRGFDRLIASPPSDRGSLLPDRGPNDPGSRAPHGAIATVVLAVLVAVGIGVLALALAGSAGEAAEARSLSSTEVTASEIVDLVEAGWADAGQAGTVSCPEPTAQIPGTSVQCTAEFDGAVIAFTAVLGDVAAGDARVVIDSWTGQPSI